MILLDFYYLLTVRYIYFHFTPNFIGQLIPNVLIIEWSQDPYTFQYESKALHISELGKLQSSILTFFLSSELSSFLMYVMLTEKGLFRILKLLL